MGKCPKPPNHHDNVYLKCRVPTLKLALHCYLHGHNITVATDHTAVQELTNGIEHVHRSGKKCLN